MSWVGADRTPVEREISLAEKTDWFGPCDPLDLCSYVNYARENIDHISWVQGWFAVMNAGPFATIACWAPSAYDCVPNVLELGIYFE